MLSSNQGAILLSFVFKSQTFHGNYDRSTVVKRFLYEGVQGRYIRVSPKTHHGGVCLRLELYGLTKQGTLVLCFAYKFYVSSKPRLDVFTYFFHKH